MSSNATIDDLKTVLRSPTLLQSIMPIFSVGLKNLIS